jgi:hypothetical protein
LFSTISATASVSASLTSRASTEAFGHERRIDLSRLERPGGRDQPRQSAEIRLLSVDPGQAGAIVRIITQFFCPFDRW